MNNCLYMCIIRDIGEGFIELDIKKEFMLSGRTRWPLKFHPSQASYDLKVLAAYIIYYQVSELIYPEPNVQLLCKHNWQWLLGEKKVTDDVVLARLACEENLIVPDYEFLFQDLLCGCFTVIIPSGSLVSYFKVREFQKRLIPAPWESVSLRNLHSMWIQYLGTTLEDRGALGQLGVAINRVLDLESWRPAFKSSLRHLLAIWS